jgi:hypothetical protein
MHTPYVSALTHTNLLNLMEDLCTKILHIFHLVKEYCHFLMYPYDLTFFIYVL